MYMQDYFWFLGAIFVCMIISALASARVRSAYAKYDKVRTRSNMTGYDAARRIMYSKGVHGIGIGRVSGTLSDHYDPKRGIVNLSASTYDGNSVAAVSVAAHEMGHVLQRENGYLFYKIRTALVPIVNFGSRLSFPLVLIGLLLNLYVTVSDPDLGYKVAMIGVILYGGSMVFALVTLPVELNASRRAKKLLLSDGILAESEMKGAEKVLSAAAFTYLASLLTSIVYFLRFLLYVMSMFGRRRR